MPNSVMPKGVEHDVYKTTDGHAGIVPNSVMPKGVEHLGPVYTK